MDQLKLSDLMKKGRDSFQKNDLKTASLYFAEIIDTEPTSTEAYFYMANIFHLRGEIGKAIKSFQKVLELDPQHTDASISLSVLYNDIGRYEDAKEIFEKANNNVKTNSQNGGVIEPHINKKFSLKHFELAEMYASYNRHDEALFEYNKAIALDPDHLEIRIKIAKVYSKKGFNSKSQEELKKLKTEHPGYHPARIALGLLYFGAGHVVEAQAEWQNVLTREPNNQEAIMYLNLSRGANETQVSM